MKAIITICSLLAALVLGWQHNDLSEAKVAAEAKAADAKNELDRTRSALEAANIRIADLSAPKPAEKSNWVEERNRNWTSPLNKGGYDNRQAVTPPVIYAVPGQTSYYTDSKGSYWIDAYGMKHYTQ